MRLHMLDSSHRNPVRPGRWHLSIAAALALLFPLAAGAAEEGRAWKEWIVPQPSVSERTGYREMLRTGAIASRDVLERVVRWKLSELTRVERLVDAPKARAQIRTDLEIAGRADSPVVHDRIAELALAHLSAVVEDPSYHPGAMYNALLMLGDLNAVERRRFNPPSPPQPLPAVLPLLLDQLERTEPGGSRPNDALRLGALVGITRHAQLGIADEALQLRMIQAATKLAAEVQAPVHRSPEAHAWMRRRAVRVLAYAAAPARSAADDEAAALVFSIIDEKDAPLMLQCEGATAWAAIAARMPAAEFDAAATAQKYAGLSGRAIRAEFERTMPPMRDMTRESSTRLLATHLSMVAESCKALKSVASAPGSDTTSAAPLDGLYERCKRWMGLITSPDVAPEKARLELLKALADLEKPAP